MTTPKEALEKCASALQALQVERSIIKFTGKWEHYGSMRVSDILDQANDALASLEGDAVERVARIIDPGAWRDQGYKHAEWRIQQSLIKARAILATGLVADEASIRGDERVARTPPGELDASHNSGEREPSVMPAYSSGGTEFRVLARLAWNNWPDTPESRRVIAEHETRDKVSSAAWDRVISTLATDLAPDEAAIRSDEREKCAEIAKSECYATAGRQIAAAIRGGGE